MRDILFRGKRKDNGEWIVGTPIIYEDGRTRIIESHTDIFCYVKDSSIIQTVAHEVDPETVGQWTGLHDSTKWEELTEKEREEFTRDGNFPSEWNGKKIFEGDIVDILTENEEIGVVVWDDGGFIVSADGFCVDFQHNIDGKDVKVIGNIHDNGLEEYNGR